MTKPIEKSGQIPMIRDSAHQIWLAGLGALSLAEDESGKLFRTLVKRGKVFEASSKERMEEVKDELRAKLDVRKATDAAIDKIGDTFDDGITEVLHRLGLPTKREIDGLAKRVERLTKTLETTPRKAPRKTTRHRAHSSEVSASA